MLGRRVAHRVERIEGAAVDLAGLRADDGGAVGGGERLAQRRGPHAALGVGVDAHDAVGPEAEQPHRAQDGDVEVGVGQQADGRRAGQPARLDVPPRAREHVVARGGQAGGVGHLTAGGDGERRRRGHAQQLGQPPADDLLGHGGGRRGDVQDRVLVPGRGEPVGRQGGREGAAEDEAEEARRLAGHEPGTGPGDERVEHGARVGRSLGQRAAERGAQRVRVGLRGPDAAFGHAVGGRPRRGRRRRSGGPGCAPSDPIRRPPSRNS